MTTMSHKSQESALLLATESKARADAQIQQIAHNVVQSTLLEMFNAGYAAALRDNNLTTKDETNAE